MPVCPQRDGPFIARVSFDVSLGITSISLQTKTPNQPETHPSGQPALWVEMTLRRKEIICCRATQDYCSVRSEVYVDESDMIQPPQPGKAATPSELTACAYSVETDEATRLR